MTEECFGKEGGEDTKVVSIADVQQNAAKLSNFRRQRKILTDSIRPQHEHSTRHPRTTRGGLAHKK